MRKGIRFALMAVAALSVLGVNVAAGQERDEERRRREAQERVEEAQRELNEALTLLEQEDGREARRRLESVIRELRRATERLDRSPVLAYTIESGLAPFIGGRSDVKMGVYLSTARDRSTDSIGAELDRVVEGGPADEAGLRDGDIITEANGEPLARTGRSGMSPGNRLIQIKNDLDDGDTLHVRYRRGSETGSADVVVVREMNDWSYSFSIPNIDIDIPRFRVGTPFIRVLGSSQLLDVELVTLDDDLGAYFGTTDGLLVIRGPSDDAIDLKSGDVILNVDGREPSSQSHLFRILRSYDPGETMVLEVMRNRTRVNVSVDVPSRDDADGNEFFFRRR